MKFTFAFLSLLATTLAATAPRASLHVPEEELSFGIETEYEEGSVNFVVDNIRTDVKPKRRLGKSNTAAPTETPILWFEVDDDDSTVSTLLNGKHVRVISPSVPDCLGDKTNCRGRIRSQVSGTMDGTGCPTLYLAAGSVKGDDDTKFGHFTVTCPSAELMASSVIEKCQGSCDMIDDFLEDRGSGSVFTFPAQGTNVVILVTCCPIEFPTPAVVDPVKCSNGKC